VKRRMSYSEWRGINGLLLVLFTLFVGLVYVFGFGPVVGVLLAVAGILSAKVFWDVSSARSAREAEQRSPCQHGIAYAKHSPDKCAECTAVRLQSEETERQQRALAHQRWEKEQARREQEFAESLRRKEFLKRMDPLEFERLVCRLYSKMGYEVQTTARTGDEGADGFLMKDGAKYVLQCKRVQNSVGQPILRDLYGTLMHFQCQGGIVVTTGSVSSAAREWAHGKPITIVEIDELQQLLQVHHGNQNVAELALERATEEIKCFWKRCDDPGIDSALNAFSAVVPTEDGTRNMSVVSDPDIDAAVNLFAHQLANERTKGDAS